MTLIMNNMVERIDIMPKEIKSWLVLLFITIVMCLEISVINSELKSIINYSTVGTIIDKEYTKSTFITHQRYQFKVSFIDNVDGKDEESVEWIDVTPTEYDEYEIGDKYEDSSRGKKE